MENTTSEWIKTLRERTHRLISTTTALELRIQQLQADVSALTEEVRRMATADEIASGVADELRRRDQSHREKVDSGLKRLVWVFGIILTGLQIGMIVAFK